MARQAPDRHEVASYVGYLLRRAHLAVGDCQAMHEGFQPKAAAILELIEWNGPVSQQWLAAYLELNRSVMVKLIDDLEASGDVARRRNPDDRRSYALEVTPSGRHRLGDLEQLARAVTAEFTSRLSVPERARLNELLARLLAPHFDPPLPPVLTEMTGFLVAHGHHRLVGICDEALRPFGLATRTFVALSVLETGEPWAQHELGAWLFIGPAATVELVDELESLGAVRRDRSAADRRSYALAVTDAGRRLVAQAKPAVQEAARVFTSPLGEEENEELVSLLARLVGADGTATGHEVAASSPSP